MTTLYDVLGVAPDASADELRRAYVDMARAVHPDRGHPDPRRMQEVNDAWRVLRDPATRAAYDRSLVAPAAPAIDPMDVPFEAPPAEPGDIGVAIARALPWVAILVVLGLIFVFTAVAGPGGGSSPAPAEQQLVGRCVLSGAASELRAVPCSQRNDGRVVLVVDRPSYCPNGSEGLAEGDRWLCLRQVR